MEGASPIGGNHWTPAMREKLVVFVVGHENWGKSYTLRALKQICNRQVRHRRVSIKGIQFLVRATSNDDVPKRYAAFINGLRFPHLIAALCPKFKKSSKRDNPRKLADRLLSRLQEKGYSLFFWVIRYKWTGLAAIHHQEISELRKYASRTGGRVRVFARAGVEDLERARDLRRFVSAIVR